MCLVHITWWLFHVHFFLQVSMQKNIFYIHLMERPSFCYCHSNDYFYSHHFCNQIICLLIVYAISLDITFGSQSCFIFAHISIRIMLDFIHPITFLSFGKTTNSQVALTSNLAISSSMALFHLGFPTAYSKQVGSTSCITLTMYA